MSGLFSKSSVIDQMINYRDEQEILGMFEEIKNKNIKLYDTIIDILISYGSEHYNENISIMLPMNIKNEQDYLNASTLLYIIRKIMYSESKKYKYNLYTLGCLGYYSNMINAIDSTLDILSDKYESE